MRIDRESHRKYQREWMRKWRAKNPERVRELNRNGREKFGDIRRKAERDFRKSNPEIARAKSRENYFKYHESRLKSMQKYRAKNIHRARARCSEWCKLNPAKVRAKNQKRRAIKKMATVTDCSFKITALSKERFCHWCCVRLTHGTYKEKIGTSFTVDHVFPLSRGGKHEPDNLVAACYSCNSSKGTKLVSEWTWEMAA